MTKKTLLRKPSNTQKNKKAKLEIEVVVDPEITNFVEKILQTEPVVVVDGPIKRRKKKPSDKPHYVNGKDFEDAIRKYYETDKITDYLGEAIKKIASGIA